MGLELEVLRKSFHSISEEKDSETEENNSEDTEKNNRTAHVKTARVFMKATGKKWRNFFKVMNMFNNQSIILLII